MPLAFDPKGEASGEVNNEEDDEEDEEDAIVVCPLVSFGAFVSTFKTLGE